MQRGSLKSIRVSFVDSCCGSCIVIVHIVAVTTTHGTIILSQEEWSRSEGNKVFRTWLQLLSWVIETASRAWKLKFCFCWLPARGEVFLWSCSTPTTVNYWVLVDYKLVCICLPPMPEFHVIYSARNEWAVDEGFNRRNINKRAITQCGFRRRKLP